MGSSRHRGHGLQRKRSGDAARGPDGCTRRNVRRIRTGASGGRLIRSGLAFARRVGLGLLVGAVFHTVAQAQVRDTSRTKRDTTRGKGDTVTTGRDTSVKRDTTKEVRVPLPLGADSMLRRDSVLRRDSIRSALAKRDTIKAPIASAEAPVLA